VAALTLTKGLCLGAYLSRGPGTCSYDTRRNIKLGVGNIDNMISQPGGGGEEDYLAGRTRWTRDSKRQLRGAGKKVRRVRTAGRQAGKTVVHMQLIDAVHTQTGEQMQSKCLVETGWSPCKWTTRPVAVTLNASYSTARIRANPTDPRRNATRDPEPPCMAQQICSAIFLFITLPKHCG
jgi:hypothetical protein